MLKRIKEFYEKQPNPLPAGFQAVFLSTHLDISQGTPPEGYVIALSGETRGTGKQTRHGKTLVVPREQPQRTSGVQPRLVHDNAEYVLGLVGEGRDPTKVSERHGAYLDLLKRAAEETQQPEFTVLLDWFKNGGADAIISAGKVTASDELYVTVNGVDPASKPEARQFWNKGPEGMTGFCLVTGESSTVGSAMPYPAKGIPNGQTSGTMLVSVNMSAGESYGLRGNENSPIGADAAESICNGLNLLLQNDHHHLTVGDSVYVYWHRDATERDFLKALKKPDEEELASLQSEAWYIVDDPRPRSTDAVTAKLKSPREGHTTSELDRADFYVLALSANASRIVVRDYHETTLTSVQTHLNSWFERIALVGHDGNLVAPPSTFRLAASLYREAKDIPKFVPGELMNCALLGRPLSHRLLAQACRRNAVMQGPFDEFNKKRVISYPRLALIKACLYNLSPENRTLTGLNEQHPCAAYQCGRLLSVLESIQRTAIPNLNATLVDRHYGAASTTPGTIFGNLLKDAISAHLPKLRKNRPGAYNALDKRLQEILSQIGSEFPTTLDHQGQGLFALGYYHQRAHDIAAAMSRKDLQDASDADDATENPS